MKTQPFRFDFTLEADNIDECIIKIFKFDVTFDENDQMIQEFNEGEGDLFDSFLDFQTDQEHEFGVHDCAQDDDDFLGFCTYEVPEERIMELMNVWKNYFMSKGFVCSDIVEVDNDC